MRHVTEVRDACDAAADIDQHVVQAHVVVDDLGSELSESRGHVRFEPVENVLHQGPSPLVPNVGDHRPERGGSPDVPQDRVARGRMEEAPQGAAEPGHRDAPSVKCLRVQFLGGRGTEGGRSASGEEAPPAAPPAGEDDDIPF